MKVNAEELTAAITMITTGAVNVVVGVVTLRDQLKAMGLLKRPISGAGKTLELPRLGGEENDDA